MKPKLFTIMFAMASCAAFFAGCTSTSAVMPASGGTYTVTKSGSTGFTPLGVLRREAYEEANKFAVSKGMVAEVISVNEVPAGFARWPQVDLKFRLVSEAERAAGEKAPSIVIAGQSSYDAMGNPTQEETRVVINKDFDFYSELKKLGELKDKGLLTEEEFQREKNRLMDARDKN